MGYRVITKDGESYVNDLNILINLARAGTVTTETKIYDTEENVWKEASEFEELEPYLKKSTHFSPYITDTNTFSGLYSVSKTTDRLLYLLSVLILSFCLIYSYSDIASDLRVKGSVDTAYSYGYIIGRISIYIALLAIGIAAIRRKPESKQAKSLFIFSVIYLLIIFLMVSGSTSNTKHDKVHLDAANKEVFYIMKDFALGNKLETKTYEESIYGPYTNFLTLNRDLYINLVKDTAQREEELKTLNLDELYTAEIFFNSASISSGEERISKAIKIIDKYIALYNDRITKHRLIIEKSNALTDFKDGFLSSFNPPGNNEVTKALELYKQSLIKYDEILKYVKKLNGNYSVSNDVLMLYDQNTLNQYNKLLGEYQAKYKEYQAQQISTQIQLKNKLQTYENKMDE